MKELPTGLQVFEKLRKADTVYVDKTDMIYKLVSGGRMQFFVSRPRRFGKTLLCWTLNALFSGKRELFEGLAISKTDWAWESYPVIHLDMSEVNTTRGADGIEKSLIILTKSIAAEYGIVLDGEMAPGDMLTRAIVEVSKKYGRPAVVIVDEYDKPFTDFYDRPDMAEDVRDVLRGYYGRLKSNESHMRFLFMTGISKFAKAGVFSTLNLLNDISLEEEFGTLFGYTEEELAEYFSGHLEAAAKKLNMPADELVEKVRNYYNGFCFDGIHRVYNPFSVLNFLQSGKFLNYWIHSGGTRVIAKYMKDRSLTVEQFRGMQVSWDFASSPGEIETATPQSFLYQTGYLTLREGVFDDFSLDYPNAEVLESMSELVYKNMTQHGDSDFIDLRTPLLHALVGGKTELVVDTVNRLLASIPYDDYVGAAKQALLFSDAKLTTQEWLYRSTILAFLRGCGVLAFGEMHGSQGRSDLVVTYRGVVWIIEIKIASNDDCRAKAEEAMAQINANQYADSYKNAKKLGIAIDDNTRQIGEWIES